MARPLRAEYPDTFYHVLSRGNDRRNIFEDSQDYERFLKLLGQLSERYSIEIWSYVLMGNHYHLLLRTREANLSKAMQWLGVSYSAYFNRRHGREGHLFQGRFKSFLIEEEEYLEKLILYIHRNPLRASIVERLSDYLWSSYRCLAYGKGCFPWLESKKIVELFRSREHFRKRTQAYSEEEDNLLENLKFGLLLGGEIGLKRMMKKLESKVVREQPQSRKLARSISIEKTVESVQRALSLSEDELSELRKPIRRRSRPIRDVLIYLCWKSSSHSLETIGKYFSVGYTTVANARARGQEHLKRNRTLRRSLKEFLS